MAKDDRLTMQEFAKRYKVSDEAFKRLCEMNGVTPETAITREEFKQMLDGSPFGRIEDPVEGAEPESKEEPVAEKKYPFSQLVQERGLSRPRVAALKVCTNWDDKTEITKTEFQAAIDKHLYNKE